jgi:ElaB/YqjD/DUF883 family membrane-anchored ribosome-binding protein
MSWGSDLLDKAEGVGNRVVKEVGQAVGLPVPVDTLTQTIKNGGLFPFLPGGIPGVPALPGFNIPNPFSFIKEAVESIAKVFQNLADSVLNKLDAVISGGAAKLQAAGTAIVDKFENAATNIITTASTTFEKLLQETIDELRKILNEAFENVKTLIAQADSYIKDRISQVGEIIASSLGKVAEIAENFTPKRIHDDLVEPALKSIQRIEEQLFKDVNQVLDKIIDKIDQTLEQVNWKANLVAIAGSQLGRDALKKLKLTVAALQLADFSYYSFWEVYLNDVVEVNSSITIEERLSVYAELQKKASIMRFLNIANAPAPAQDDLLARKWLTYGILYNTTKLFLGATSGINTGKAPSLLAQRLSELLKKQGIALL